MVLVPLFLDLLSMNSAVDEIKDKLQIEDLVSQYVQLKKVGRSLKGLCPFHSEKTPSFVVSPERGIAYCFGCNKGGDIFKFVQEVENVDFVDALKILAERTGVKLESYKQETRVSSDQKEQLIQLHDLAVQFYQDQLWQTDDGAKVLQYLHARGLTDESIKLFKVGFAPDSYEKTFTYLLNKGFTRNMLVSAGLAMTKETTVEKIYDKFRGRLMFPITDSLGRVVGFGGRALSKEQEPKYLNSPETVIYHKSNVLYGFSYSKVAIKQTEEAMIVEGYMDLIASFQAGVKNVVATSGTALTLKQLRLLKPFVKTVCLAFDMDLAGQEAVKRAYELAQEFDFAIRVLVLPEGKDAAEYVKLPGADLVKVLKSSPTFGDYFYKKLLDSYGTADMSAKKRILQDFLPFFNDLKSNVEKDGYVRRLATDLDLKEVQIYDEIRNFKLPAFHPARSHGALDLADVKQKKYSAAELLLGFMLESPRVAKILSPILLEAFFPDPLKPIYKVLADQYNVQGVESGSKISVLLPEDLKQEAALLSLYVNEKYGELSEEAIESEMKNLVDSLGKNIFSAKTRDLQKQIMEAEKSGDKSLLEKLLGDLNLLYKGRTLQK